MTDIATENHTTPIIPVFTAEIGGIAQPAVNARVLHQFLGSKRQFANWIKKRLSEYDFMEGQDYTVNNFVNGDDRNGTGQDGKFIAIDYHLTLDTAKELAMVEKTPAGRLARRYFIECERQLNSKISHNTQPEIGCYIDTTLEEDIREYSLLIPDIFKRNTECSIKTAFECRILFWTIQRRDGLILAGVSDQILLLKITLDTGYAISCEISRDVKQYRKENPLIRNNVEAIIEYIGNWKPSY